VNAARSPRSARRFAYIAPVTDDEARELLRRALEEHRARVAGADLAPDDEPDHAGPEEVE
jgi:hypothetical protein